MTHPRKTWRDVTWRGLSLENRQRRRLSRFNQKRCFVKAVITSPRVKWAHRGDAEGRKQFISSLVPHNVHHDKTNSKRPHWPQKIESNLAIITDTTEIDSIKIFFLKHWNNWKRFLQTLTRTVRYVTNNWVHETLKRLPFQTPASFGWIVMRIISGI